MIDTTDFAALVGRQPRLYHAVFKTDDDAKSSVIANGIEGGISRHHWGRLWRPRPGHCYLATHTYLKKALGWNGGGEAARYDIFAIDPSYLVPSRINPDEDHFLTNDQINGENMIGDRHATQVFRLPFPPTPWMEEWSNYLKLKPLPTFGEWADQINLGDDPAQTRFSIRKGSIAYNGVVPPAALTYLGRR